MTPTAELLLYLLAAFIIWIVVWVILFRLRKSFEKDRVVHLIGLAKMVGQVDYLIEEAMWAGAPEKDIRKLYDQKARLETKLEEGLK